MKNKLFLQLCFTLFFALPIMAQKNIELRVVNKNTNEPVPFAHAIFEVGRGTIFNENGQLTLVFSDEQETQELTISCIGYKSESIMLNLNNNEHIIRLEPIAIQLPEFVVQADNSTWRTTQLGTTRRRPRGGYNYMAGCEIALLIEIPNRKNYLKNIQFYITDKNNPQEKFRAIIYSVNKETGLPGKPVLEKNIILNAQRGNEWVSYDVSQYAITIPEEGLFIAMQWLPESAEQKFHLFMTSDGREVFANGQQLGGRTERVSERNIGTVARRSGGSWVFRDQFTRNGKPVESIIIPFIKSDVIEKRQR
jgi:hypothetical protein